MNKMQRTIRRTACLLTMAAACLSAPAQTVVDATAKPSAVDQKQLPLDHKPLALDQKPLALEQQIAALVAQPAVARAHWGIIVTTLDGKPLYTLNEGQLFQPASNAKLFTAAAALALLGPDKTFTTTVKGTLDAATGNVTGDLVIVGRGDANLSGRRLPYTSTASQTQPPSPPPDPLRYLEDMADQLAVKGVRAVAGDIVGDDTYFPWEPYPSGWSIDDAVWGYAAPVSALSVADNHLLLTVPPGTITGPEGRQTYHNAAAMLDQNGVPYYTVESRVNVAPANASNGIQVERAPGSKTIRVYGQIAEGANPDVEEIAIADPAEYAAMAFKQMLEARGIAVQGTARAKHQLPQNPFGFLTFLQASDRCEQLVLAGGQCGGDCFTSSVSGSVLASHLSPSLAQDVMLTNKVSQNLHAELMLRHLGKRVFCGEGTAASGARMVRAFLINAGIDKDDFVFYDGSGLSGYDLVTPRATAKLLSFAAHDPKTGASQPWFADWKASLPIGGVDGTLTDRFTTAPLKGHVFAKTGTMGEANALSGYLDCASGQTVIFSILVGNHLPGDSADRDVMDKIVAAIVAME